MKNIYSNKIAKNLSWLTLIQLANYIIPLLVIPYIVRVLGVELFGQVTYAQTIVSYFTLIVNFGFDYSATKQIAIHKQNTDKRTEIFWSVIKQKALLLIISCIAMFCLGLAFDKAYNNPLLYLYAFLINFGFLLFPTWFFQGIEEMGKMAIFNLIIKASGLLLTVAFVHNPTQYLLFPLFNSLAYIVCGIIALLFVIKRYNLTPIWSNTHTDKQLFSESLPICLNNIFASGYTITNLTLLGLFANDTEVGIYSGAFKIIMAILMVTSTPISMAIFPAISRHFANSPADGLAFFKKITPRVALYGLIISIGTFFTAPLLVKILLGTNFLEAINLLRLFALLPFLVIFASLFTIQGLYGAGLQRYAPLIGATLAIFCIGFNCLTTPTWGSLAAAWGWILAQILEIILAASLFYFGFARKLNWK